VVYRINTIGPELSIMTTSRTSSARPRAVTALPSPESRAYFPALDGIRGFAFLMVFATHYLQLPWGWAGVNIFLVLSGFLITGILYDTRDHLHRVENFYLRRTLRIFPLYYALILLLVLLYPVFRWQWSWAWLIWPAYLGNMARCFNPGAPGSATALLEFAQPLSRSFPQVQLAFGHFWSLCVEEQFYLIWPWVVFAIGDRRKLVRLCAAGLILLPILRVLAGHAFPGTMDDRAALITVTPLPFDALLLGGLVALLRRGPWADKVLPASRAVFAALTAVFLLWLAINPAARHMASPYPYPRHIFTLGLSFIDIFSACLIVMALEHRSITFRIFNLRPLRGLGRISYGAYVFHDIFHTQIARLANHSPSHRTLTTAAIALASTLLLAWTSFRWLETPFIRLKDRWTLRPAAATSLPQTPPSLIEHVA
jgi:peptidoglycan/LPS O-acetylase OafA/YrhL